MSGWLKYHLEAIIINVNGWNMVAGKQQALHATAYIQIMDKCTDLPQPLGGKYCSIAPDEA